MANRPSGGGGQGMTKVRFRTCLRNTIYDALRNRPGWTETESDSEFDFVWADVPWMREHFDGLRLEEQQRVNHFRNHYELTRKDLMVKNLKRMRKQLEREDKHAEALQYDFFPVTFILPSEYHMFVEDFKRFPDATWIAKPVGRAQGRGIFLFNDLGSLQQWKKAYDTKSAPVNSQNQKVQEDVEVYVAQRYIDNPYLIGGKKFDLRLYVLVTSYLPLRIWMYRSGFARFSNHRFTMQRGDISNAYVHLTNVAIQKTAPSYDKETGCKWDLRAMKLFMVSKHGMDPVNKCMADIQTLCIRSLQSVQKVMMNDKHCFELYGYDVMIDDELKPWLIEVNASPSLSSDTTADHELKVGMLEDMTDIVDMEKKMTGREDQVGGFDLIFNNGPVRKERPMGTQTLLGCYNNRVRNKQKLAQAHRVRETHHGEAAAAKK
mmetsp:Transcript_53274/g.126801  ORF Transcript_53274/g.126801 Transcript_53274/m.126801 type:complete len:433 (+) Transcript_53274:86-1384(+)